MRLRGECVRAMAALGHLGVFNGLYVAGAVVALGQTAGLGVVAGPRGVSWAALVCAFGLGTGVYLFDRVKLSDRLLDPADLEAHPGRYAFLGRLTGAARALSAIFGLAGAAAAWRLHPAAAGLAPCAYAGVWVYAGRRGKRTGILRRRVKDVFVVKNLAVAGSIALLAEVLGVLGAVRGGGTEGMAGLPWVAAGWSGLFVFGHVFADSALCDLDDEESDRRFGTGTLPSRLGRGATWGVALALNVALAAGAIGMRASNTWTGAAQVAWGLGMLGTLVLIPLFGRGGVRNLIDLRMPAVAVMATLTAVWRG